MKPVATRQHHLFLDRPGCPHSVTPEGSPSPKAEDRAGGTLSVFRDSATHFQSPSTSAPPPAPDNSNFQSPHMCLCVCMSEFYLHYPCLLLATETKYFKAEKASQPTGLLLPILLPAQGRGCKGSSEPQSTMKVYSSHALGEPAWSQFTPSRSQLCGAPTIGPTSPSLEVTP